MFTSLDTTIALGCILCVWTFSPCSQAQDLPRTKRQNSLYFREPAGRSSRVRFQDDSPISWSSPSERIQSRSSEDHDPGPSRQARFTDSPWQAGGSSSSLRFQEDGGSSEGRSSGSSFKFQDDLGSSEGRSSFKFDDDKSVSFGSTPSSPFRFGSGGVEGRSNSDEHFGFPSAESNEFYGRNSDFSKDSGEDFPWKSSPEPSVFPGGKRHSGRQSKVSPIFESKPPSDSFEFPSSEDSDESPRHLSPDTIATISETLGAINTVGRYLVNYTRGSGGQHPHGNYRPHPTPGLYGDRLDEPPSRSNEDLPGAILTISKNVLGRNVTDSIAPLVRVLPIGSSENSASGPRPCTTPGGKHGVCEDLSNCPQLLLDLGNLRQSICFKSLFVPGVCCPKKEDSGNTFLQEIVTTTRPMILTTKFPLITAGTQASYTTTTTQRPNSIDYEFSTLGECGVQEAPKFRVVGGEEALPGRWPWMAAIFLHGPRRTEFWCGGSLIGSRHVLTAAHCTKDTRQRPFQARQFTVRLGDIDLKRDDEPSSPQTYRVADVRAHPRFNRQGFYNDIAVLVLDRPVRRSRYIIPVCLPPPTSRHNNFVGEQPTVVGWGTTYYGGKESTVQRQVALPVWKNEDCDKTYFQPINENFICAGLKEGGKDACQGDSGGPLVLKKNGRWMQIGIVSFGNKCGEPGYPGVYTRVTQYLDWITGNMN